MVGRFLTIPFLISLLLISQTFLQNLNIKKILMTCILVVVLGLLSPLPSFKQIHPEGSFIDFHGVHDERDFYFYGTGLLRSRTFILFPEFSWIDEGKNIKQKADLYGGQIIIARNIGFFGYYAGHNVYIIDSLALGNAFLAHQKLDDTTVWRIGHFERKVNQEYLQTVQTGENKIQNKEISKLYDDIYIRTKERVFDIERLIYLLKFDITIDY